MKQQPPDPERRRLLAWLWRLPVVAALAGAGYGVFEAGRVIFGKSEAEETPEFRAIPPVPVASLASFASVWDTVVFEAEGTPAVAVRLPEAGAGEAGGLTSGDVHLAAYSRVCTHQGCIVSLNRDLEAIAFGFNYRAQSPQLVCPCHLSVFSPLQGGQAMSGPAVAPLPRIRLRLDGDQVVAVGIEGTQDATG